MAKPFKLFLDVSQELPGWQQTCASIYTWLETHTTILDDDSSGWVDVNQEILDISKPLFAQMRLVPVHVAVYVSKGEEHKIHLHETLEHARLNLPIANCGGTYTAFFKANAEPTITKNAQGVELIAFEEKDCLEIGRTTIDVPTVLHIRTPHQVIAPLATKDKPRITASFQFERDPILILRK